MSIPAPPSQKVITHAAVEQIVAVSTAELVVPRRPGQDIVAAQSHKHVCGAIAGEAVVEVRAGEVLNAHERVGPGPARILRAGQIEVDDDPGRRPDVARPPDDEVAVISGIDPGSPVQQVITHAAVEAVASAIA